MHIYIYIYLEFSSEEVPIGINSEHFLEEITEIEKRAKQF